MKDNPHHTAATARRGFLALTAGAAAAAAAALSALPASAQVKNEAADLPVLDPAKWSARNHAVLSRFIARHGDSARGKKTGRPYAVFDWDNTAIMNDTEDALFMHQINTLAFKLTPKEFGDIVRQNVPAGAFTADYKNSEGRVVTLEDIAADLDADYAWLHANYIAAKGPKTLEAIRETPQFLDFRTKLYYAYEAVNDTHGVSVGYPWVVYFLANMTVGEVTALTEQSNDLGLGAGLVRTTYTSPAATPGRSGVVSVKHFHGLRLTTEIASLMNALRANGIDVYVCTASLEHVVGVFASLPKYGFHVPRANVLGLRLEERDGMLVNQYRKDWPLTWGPGKTVAIQRELVASKGYGPVFVAGDSDGDYDMLHDFADTQLGLIVNRLKKGKIGELSQLAAVTAAVAEPRYLLQGRQEASGNWVPSEQTIKLGSSAAKLIA